MGLYFIFSFLVRKVKKNMEHTFSIVNVQRQWRHFFAKYATNNSSQTSQTEHARGPELREVAAFGLTVAGLPFLTIFCTFNGLDYGAKAVCRFRPQGLQALRAV